MVLFFPLFARGRDILSRQNQFDAIDKRWHQPIEKEMKKSAELLLRIFCMLSHATMLCQNGGAVKWPS